MTDMTRILNLIDQGDPVASEQLLPLVYEELRILARQRLANEKPGQTLQATALVHEAYLRLVGKENDQSWDNRGHFFAAAAESMRRIMIEAARRRSAEKNGGDAVKVELLDNLTSSAKLSIAQLLDLDEALTELEQHDAQAANLVKLRFFSGFSHSESAQMLGISRRHADRLWLVAKSWLFRALEAN